eukprot:1942903-Rhodomonas_salina.3
MLSLRRRPAPDCPRSRPLYGSTLSPLWPYDTFAMALRQVPTPDSLLVPYAKSASALRGCYGLPGTEPAVCCF